MEEIKKTIIIVIYGGILCAVFFGGYALMEKHLPALSDKLGWVLGIVLLLLLGWGIKKIKED